MQEDQIQIIKQPINMSGFHPDSNNINTTTLNLNNQPQAYIQNLQTQFVQFDAHSLLKMHQKQNEAIKLIIQQQDQHHLQQLQEKLVSIQKLARDVYKAQSSKLYSSCIDKHPGLLNTQSINKHGFGAQSLNPKILNHLYYDNKEELKNTISNQLSPAFVQMNCYMNLIISKLQVASREIQGLAQNEQQLKKVKQEKIEVVCQPMIDQSQESCSQKAHSAPEELQAKIKNPHKKRKRSISKSNNTKERHSSASCRTHRRQPSRSPKTKQHSITKIKRWRSKKKSISQVSQNQSLTQPINSLPPVKIVDPPTISMIAQTVPDKLPNIATQAPNQRNIGQLRNKQFQKKLIKQQASLFQSLNNINEENNKVLSELQRQSQIVIQNQADLQRIMQLSPNHQANRLVVFYKVQNSQLVELVTKLKPKEIILNCSLKLQHNFIQSIPQSVTQSLQIFEQNWDHNNHFEKLAHARDFPTSYLQVGLPEKLHFNQRSWQSLKNLKNVWISCRQDLIALKKSKIDMRQVESLRIEPCHCKSQQNKNFHFFKQCFQFFQHLHNLKTIVVKGCNLKLTHKQIFLSLLKNNLDLECLFLQNNQGVLTNQLDLHQNKSLKKLAIISWTARQFDKQSNFKDIFILPQLQYLYIKGVNFNQAEISFQMLQKLVFLHISHSNIFHVYNYNSMLSKLNQKVYQQLKYLNLSSCNINSSVMQALAKCQSLTHLGLDNACFKLENFFDDRIKKSKLAATLRYLSLANYDSKDYSMSQPFIGELAKVFINLAYINIYKSYHLITVPILRKMSCLRDVHVDSKYVLPLFIQAMEADPDNPKIKVHWTIQNQVQIN